MMNYKNLIKSALSVVSFIYLANGVVSTVGIYPIMMIAILYFLYQKIELDKNIWTRIGAIVFGMYSILSLFQVNVYESQLQDLSTVLCIIKLIAVFLGVYFFVEMILSIIYRTLDKTMLKENSKASSKVVFFGSFIVLLFLYLLVWMMEYPSNIYPDTISQINQIIEGEYVNHHPFLHTMYLKILMSFSNDINKSVGIAAFIQMIINALVFSYGTLTIHRKTRNMQLTIFSLLFCGLLSFNSFFSITLIKDVPHAMICYLLTITLINYNDESSIQKKKMHCAFIGLLSILFCLFRTNGYYVCILVFLVSLLLIKKTKDFRIPIVLFISIIISTIIKGPIYTLIGVDKASIAEALSIPLQQIAFAIKNNCYLTDSELSLLKKVIDVTKISESYDVFLSDPIKNLLNSYGNIDYLLSHKLEYIGMWINIGLRNPIIYLRAWINQFSMLISPYYYSTSIFWGVWENNLGVIGTPILITGNLNETLHNLAYYQHYIPVIGWFHYPSFATWIMTMSAFYLLKRHEYIPLTIFSIYAGILITLCISSPYNACFRYYYSVVCCVPLVALLVLKNNKKE